MKNMDAKLRSTARAVNLNRTRLLRRTPGEVYWRSEKHHLLDERKALQERLSTVVRDNLQLKSDLVKAQEKIGRREQKIVTLHRVFGDLERHYDAVMAAWRELTEERKRAEENKQMRDEWIITVRCIQKIQRMERQAEIKHIRQRELSEWVDALQTMLSDAEEELRTSVERIVALNQSLLPQIRETESMRAGPQAGEVSSGCKNVFEVCQEIGSIVNKIVAELEEKEKMSAAAKESASRSESESMEESSVTKPSMVESLSEKDRETLTELSDTAAHLDCSQQTCADLREIRVADEDQSLQLEA